jgi:hypothetical protein
MRKAYRELIGSGGQQATGSASAPKAQTLGPAQ